MRDVSDPLPLIKRRRVQVLAICIVLALMLGVITWAVRRSSGQNSVTVQALWYGKDVSGTISGGVTPVEITAIDADPSTALVVDLHGLDDAGAGPMWKAATANAALFAVLESGIDPRLLELRYSLDEAIDGPSAGGLLSVGTLAAISDSPIAATTTMTGTVMPDGSLGDVSGVPEKVRAAAAAGFTRVLVPAGQLFAIDPQTRTSVDVVAAGKAAGVEVVGVETVPQAFELISSPTAPVAQAEPAPIDPQMLQLLTQESARMNASTRLALKATPGGAAPGQRNIDALLVASDAALAAADPVMGFASAAEAAEAIQVRAASAKATRALQAGSLSSAVAQVRADAEKSRAEISVALRSAAETPVTTVEQLSALSVDALAWGDFALTSVNVVLARLDSVTTPAELDELVRFFATAQFEAGTYMPFCVQMVGFAGSKPMADVAGAVDLLGAYAEFLDYAADANRTYARSLGHGADRSDYLTQLMDESDLLSDETASEFPSLQGPTALVALQLSAAVLDYIETTQLVMGLTSETPGGDGPPNQLPVRDQAAVRADAEIAQGVVTKQTRQITAAGLDPSYLRWNGQWGADLAFGLLPDVTDEQKLHGLEFQWFASLQGRLLAALNAHQNHP